MAAPPVSPFEKLRAKARRLALERLDGSAGSLAAAGESVENYTQIHLNLIEEQLTVLTQTRRQPGLACKKGCAHCCHTQVAATVPEVARLAQYILAEFSGEEIEAIKGRLREHRQRILDLKGEPRPPTPCPLLRDDVCTVHPARPLSCRAFNSMDVNACISARENWREPAQIPGVAKQVYTIGALHEGLCDSLLERGYRDEMLEMPIALLTLLENPDAIDGWLGGADVFAEAREHGGEQR